ncbi:hypothetical protein [Dankookia sp. P2]
MKDMIAWPSAMAIIGTQLSRTAAAGGGASGLDWTFMALVPSLWC